MILHLHRPAAPLDRFVELVTYYAGYEPSHRKERLLPDGAVEIIVDLTDTPKRTFDRETLAADSHYRNAWISGMRKNWIVIEAAPGSSMVVIRFRPGGAYPFLGFAVEGITDVVDELDDVLGSAATSLRDRILASATVEEKMRAVESWLMERGGPKLESHPVVEYLTGRLFAPAGIRISDVVAEVGYSERHVLSLFRHRVGITPKQYGRIQRFQRMLDSVAEELRKAPPERRPEPDWADVALEHGYYDQAHLIHDFRTFSGITPTRYTRDFVGLENYLPIE